MGKIIMTKYVGNNCLGKTPCRSFRELGAGVLVVCQFCFGGRWCLGGTLGFVHVLGVSVVSWQCSGGVLVVLKEWHL